MHTNKPILKSLDECGEFVFTFFPLPVWNKIKHDDKTTFYNPTKTGKFF